MMGLLILTALILMMGIVFAREVSTDTYTDSAATTEVCYNQL